MTIITVNAPSGRLNAGHRKSLALELTDAVLTVETGQLDERARIGFQVYFRQFDATEIAIGGRLLSDQNIDVMHIDVAVMEAYWPKSDRAKIINNMYRVLCRVLDQSEPSPSWWINFRIIDEGSWGSRGGVTSIHDLLSLGVFTRERIELIEEAMRENEE